MARVLLQGGHLGGVMGGKGTERPKEGGSVRSQRPSRQTDQHPRPAHLPPTAGRVPGNQNGTKSSIVPEGPVLKRNTLLLKSGCPALSGLSAEISGLIKGQETG